MALPSLSNSTRIHCLRHAEVDARWRDQIYGGLDVPLSEAGERASAAQARALADLELAAVVSSGLGRTEHMARELRAARALERRDDARLVEISRGTWAGTSIAELEAREPGAFARWLAHPKDARPPQGESLSDVAERAWPALLELAREFPAAELAVVSHLWVLRSLLCRVLELDLDRAASLELPYATHFAIDLPLSDAHRPVLAGLAMRAGAHGCPGRGSSWQRGPHRT
ncbi:MAG: histidine phosphatase family protein [Planctomycetes bacterium]|nr:histidine phosphatase family protein [Planctomycetota bacterium]